MAVVWSEGDPFVLTDGFLTVNTGEVYDVKAFFDSSSLKKKERWHLSDGTTLDYVHRAEDCKGPSCAFHNPTDHHMLEWQVSWEPQPTPHTPRLYRLCEHGIGHPDPDEVAWLESQGHTQWHECLCQGPKMPRCCVEEWF